MLFYCLFQVPAALLCHLIGHTFAQRSRRGPVALSANARLVFDFLVATQCLPPCMCRVLELCQFASPIEASQLFLSCWRFVTRFPPQLDQYDAATCMTRSFGVAVNALPILMLSFRLCVANNIDQAQKVLTPK